MSFVLSCLVCSILLWWPQDINIEASTGIWFQPKAYLLGVVDGLFYFRYDVTDVITLINA